MTTPGQTHPKELASQSLHPAQGGSERDVARGLVLLLLLFVGPLVGATYWMYVQAARGLERGELEGDLLRARTLAALVEREFVSTEKILTSIANRHMFRHAWAERDLRVLEQNLRETRKLEPTFLFVSVYERDGTLRAIFPRDQIVGQNFAYRDWYRGVTKTWEPYVSEAYRTAAGAHLLVVAVAVPIRDERGQPSGILMATYALDQLGRKFEALQMGSSGTPYVVDQRGFVIVGPGIDPQGELVRAAEPEDAARALAGQEGSGRSGSGGGESFIGYAPVSRLGWAVIYRRAAKDALRAAADLRRGNLSISFYLILVYVGTIALAALLVRRQSQLLAANQALNESLRESEKRTRLIVDTAQDAFVAMDADGLITDWNAQAETTFGWSRLEVIGRSLADTIIPLKHREAHRRGLKHFLTTGEGPVLNKRIEIEALHRDGHEFPVELTISPIRIGESYLFNAFVHDITERKRAEDALARQAENLARSERELRNQTSILQSVLQSMGDGVVVADQSGKFLLFNPAAERIVGMGPTNTTPKQWTSQYGLYLPDTVTPYPPEELPLARAIRGESVDSAEVFVRHSAVPQGVWVNVTARPLKDENGALAGGVVVFRDVSSSKRAEEALRLAKEEAERASKFKDQFLSTMSHELRTPLNAVLGFSELLSDARYGALNDRQSRYVSHINTSGQHLLRLINDILDLSKIEAGHLQLAIENVRVESAFGEVLSALQPLAEKKSQTLSQGCETSLSVRADATRFKQALMNLVGNAIKFTPEGGRVELVARMVDGKVQVEVHDTGPGIPPEEQKRIFEAFYQLRQSGKAAEGTGLGLAITQRLVELQGGELGVESQPGQGSCFSFSLPAAPAVQETRPRKREETLRASGSPRILVIEDDPAAGQLIQSQLTSSGYEVVVCHEPQHGAAIAAELQPDAITLDLLMKPISGWELLLELKNQPPTANVPVIVITIVDQRAMGAVLGADEYLVKPVKKAALLAAVERCLTARGGARPARPILVVEDDTPTCEVITELLTGQGYSVATAADGAEARTRVAASLPELVILDLLLPKVSGFELLAEWRASSRTADLPIFVLTSKDLNREEEKYLREHAEYLLRKQQPWQETLVRQVRRALGQNQPVKK